MLTCEEYVKIKNEIETTSNGTLVYMAEEYLNKIKDLLTITKMVVLEIQVRKELEK